MNRGEWLAVARRHAEAGYDRPALLGHLERDVTGYRFGRGYERARLFHAAEVTVSVLDTLPGQRLADRWRVFEADVWPAWQAGRDRPALGDRWTWGVWALIGARLVRPSWAALAGARVHQWTARMPADDPLVAAAGQLRAAAAALPFGTPAFHATAVAVGQRLLLVRGLDEVTGLTEADLLLPGAAKGADILDAALCHLGVFDRTPRRGIARRLTADRHPPAALATVSGVPEPFREIVGLYLETYARRLSGAYPTLRAKARALAHFFGYLRATHPEVTCCAAITPAHARAFRDYAVTTAAGLQRGRHKNDTEPTTTPHAWLVDVRAFFADVCTWAAEPGSPFTAHAPALVPLTRHDLLDAGFRRARQRSEARLTSHVLDLQRQIPAIRAFALRRWHEAQQAVDAQPGNQQLARAERIAFWDWALLELLLTSGLRIEEACELTTLDVLRRQLPDGRLYYLLHVKPSKFGRARLVPIGDQLGRVIAEIIRHIRGFYGATEVPACDRRDEHEKTPLPRAPYLLQARTHPSTLNTNTIRGRLRALSVAAGARRADGEPLELTPHDCRRVFASEQLNGNTPVHVIQALLGHATVDTVMIYAKLYPASLVDGYRAAMRGLYTDVYGPDASRTPTGEEWTAFAANCSLRDMGTHVCALPTGEHCPRGLVCLGCTHAQPKKSAAPVFRRMLTSHTRALDRARTAGEPAGQIAARELEIDRIRSALTRADELTGDVAATLEAV